MTMAARDVVRAVIDVNVLISNAMALRAGRVGTLSQNTMSAILNDDSALRPVQMVLSHAMLDTFARIACDKGFDPNAIMRAVAGYAGLMRHGPDAIDPYLVLGGTPIQTLDDEEDGGVLATAIASRSRIIVTNNIDDFKPAGCEVIPTSTVRLPDGSTRDLEAIIISHPSGHQVIAANPADFMRWLRTGFDFTSRSLRARHASALEAATSDHPGQDRRM